MKRVHYSMYGAAVCCGITENVWKQMEKLGYKVISGTIYTVNDEGVFEVENFIENPPEYIQQWEDGRLVK